MNAYFRYWTKLLAPVFALLLLGHSPFALSDQGNSPSSQMISAACVPGGKVVTDEEELACLVRNLVQAKFPSLAGVSIGLKTYNEKNYYLQTTIERKFAPPKQRHYFIEYNPWLLDASASPPPTEALVAVLAHELVHIRDYASRSALGLLKLAAQYLSQSTIDAYERHTDMGALQLGFGPGLKKWRIWDYYQLRNDPEALATKKARYFTPDEIDAWEKTRALQGQNP